MMVTKMPEVTESTPAPQNQTGKCQKDESSVNREIATLLLNLASRTQSGQSTTGQQLQREAETEAMDLSKVRKEREEIFLIPHIPSYSSTLAPTGPPAQPPAPSAARPAGPARPW